MPWSEVLLMDQRVQFIGDYQRQTFDVTASYTGGAAGADPVAFVDLHDGTGPHQEAVSGGTSGTIDISFAKAPAPGIYHPTIILSDTVGGCPTADADFTRRSSWEKSLLPALSSFQFPWSSMKSR